MVKKEPKCPAGTAQPQTERDRRNPQDGRSLRCIEVFENSEAQRFLVDLGEEAPCPAEIHAVHDRVSVPVLVRQGCCVSQTDTERGAALFGPGWC